ncbi:MAG: toprim domain-containing protein [Acidimicrobiales bacterium]|nr:toprim domain-containing protein [Acidimicrobiales bacterium]
MHARTRTRWTITDVLDRTDLAGLLDDYSPAEGQGHRRRWHCPVPDHHDHHASVTMATDAHGHERWRCWSGDDTHRGDAIDLVMITQRTDRAAAIEHLAQRAGICLDEPLPAPRPRPVPTRPVGPVPLHESVHRYVAACENVLWSRSGQPVRAWLHERGLNDETLRANRVGADPGRRLMQRPGGLPVGRSPAATFPALTPTGAVAYVQTRYLEPAGGPKYENPASRLGTNPRLAWTTPAQSSGSKRLLVCEGIPDALTAAQQDLRSVAVLGAQAPDARVADTLVEHCAGQGLQLVAVIDNDDAGRAWGARLQDLLAERDTTLAVVEPPNGLDLNAWALAEPAWWSSLDAPSAAVGLPSDPLGVAPIDLGLQ